MRHMKTASFILFYSLFVTLGSHAQVTSKKTDKEYQVILLQKTFEELGTFNNETGYRESEMERVKIPTDYIGLFTNDSITIYNLQGGESLFYAIKNDNNNLTIRCKIDQSNTENLSCQFNSEKSSITVNSNTYYLTKSYFDYLYEQGYNKSNILLIISLFLTNLECFPCYSILIDNLWFPREQNNKYRIIRSEITTNCGYDSSINHKWKVTYSYDENGRIDEVTKILFKEDNIYLKIKMYEKEKTTYSYGIFHLDEGERYSEELNYKINEEQLTDCIYSERQQNGYTYLSISKTVKRTAYHTDKLQLAKEIIKSIIEKKKDCGQ